LKNLPWQKGPLSTNRRSPTREQWKSTTTVFLLIIQESKMKFIICCGQVVQQIRHRHHNNSSKSRSPGPQRRKSLNRAKSERLPKSSTSLDTHLISIDEIGRQYPDKPCNQSPSTASVEISMDRSEMLKRTLLCCSLRHENLGSYDGPILEGVEMVEMW
jgi:hypothetical protein